jgi:hypothetical protein
MKQNPEQAKPLSEREVQAFLNDLSEQGSIQWRRAGIWRWVSVDGLAFAVSDGRTVDISRTANGETKTVSLAPLNITGRKVSKLGGRIRPGH